MSFEGEFAYYEPLRRILDSDKIKALQDSMFWRKPLAENALESSFIYKKDLTKDIQPDLVLAIDGSNRPAKARNGFPGAEIGYITIASVLIDLGQTNELAKDDIIDPKKFRETEKASTIESVFPGCNVTMDDDDSPKSSLRRAIFNEFKNNSVFPDSETLLDTYEHLFRIKRRKYPDSDSKMPWSPIEGIEERMTYDYGEYKCPHTAKALYSTDALRLHELMNPNGSNGELFGQIMATIEKLWLIHIIRAFEKKEWLTTLRRVAFIMDGPLAVFSTSSWLTKTIEVELRRLNDLQKSINGTDLMILGIEPSGTFYNHFSEIDTTADGVKDQFPTQSALLLDDRYIKSNIIYSHSEKPYGQDTYFGRKFFYKTQSGHKIVPSVAVFNEEQKNLDTATANQFPRLADIMSLLDSLSSNQFPNSISPLISAHAEAVIPLNIGKRIFEDMAREIKEKKKA